MANPLSDQFQVRSRSGHKKARKRLEFGNLALAGAAGGALPFPGSLSGASDTGGRVVSSAVSLLIHGALIGGIAIAAWLTPDEVITEVMEIVSVEDQSELPQRPRAISPASRFKPPVALAPQFHSPAAVQRRAPTIVAPQVRVDAVQISQAAPTRIPRLSQPLVTSAQAFKPLTPAKSRQVDVEVAKTEVTNSRRWAPNKALMGPKRIVSNTNAIGATALGTASARTGAGALAGSGPRAGVFAPEGAIKGPKGDACLEHPSVVTYVNNVKDRVYARWHVGNVSGSHQVTLRLQIESSGTAKFVEVVEGTNDTLSLSAAKALRAASPFAPMRGSVRCLSREALLLTFINESAS